METLLISFSCSVQSHHLKLSSRVVSILQDCERESITSAWRIFPGDFLALETLSGQRDSVVHVYQGAYILASVNGMGIYPRTTLSQFTFSYLWGCWLRYCSVHCKYFFILSLSSNFATLSVSVLYLQSVGWLIGEWSLQWNWWSGPLKILCIFFVLIYYQMYDFHIFSLLLLIVFSNSLHFNGQ